MPTKTDSFIGSVKPLFNERRNWRLFMLATVGIFIVTLANEITSTVLGPVALLLFVGIFFKLVLIESSLERQVWQNFNDQLDKPHAPSGKYPILGVMSRIGDQQTSKLLAEGHYGNYDIRLFDHTVVYSPHSQSSSFSRKYRVLEIKTHQNFYPVFIDSKSNNNSQIATAMNVLSRSVKNNKTLTVEGDVNKFFKIFVPPVSKSESLVTLTPDKLLALRDYGTGFDIEFSGSSIFLITRAKIKTMKDIIIYQKNVFDLLNNLGINISRKRADIKNQLVVTRPKLLTFF